MVGRIIRSIQPANVISDADGYRPLFYTEINSIMRGLGDSPKPLHESVILMEKILKQQLEGILNEAGKAAQRRSENEHTVSVHSRDILYIMRRNRIKAMRLIKFFKEYSAGKNLERETSANCEAEFDVEERLPPNFLADVSHLVRVWKRDLKHDEEKIRRAERADFISRRLSGPAYLEYAKARRVSFCSKNATELRTKLRNWLLPRLSMQISETAMLAIGFLVHETIARIVDMAFLVRIDSSRKLSDRIDKFPCRSHLRYFKPQTTDMVMRKVGEKALTVAEISEAVRRYNQPGRLLLSSSPLPRPRLIAIS